MNLPLAEILKLETRLPLELIEIPEKLLEDIKSRGIIAPIQVRIREDNSLIVGDGLNRLAIAIRLNLKTVPVIFMRM